MPLRKSPVRTPAFLAANRANARKSSGPRTPCGRARVSLNALKHGRSMGPAGRAPRFRERLLRAGYRQQEALYGGLRSCLAQAFGARSPPWRRQVDQFAASAWCVVMGRNFFRTKPESPLDSRAEGSRVLSPDAPRLVLSLRYRAEDPWRRIAVTFWLQRRRYLTSARVKRMFQGQERGIGGPGALPGVPAAAAGILRAVAIQPRPERRPRLEPRAVAEHAALSGAMGSWCPVWGAAPAAAPKAERARLRA